MIWTDFLKICSKPGTHINDDDCHNDDDNDNDVYHHNHHYDHYHL